MCYPLPDNAGIQSTTTTTKHRKATSYGDLSMLSEAYQSLYANSKADSLSSLVVYVSLFPFIIPFNLLKILAVNYYCHKYDNEN
jgi:hypothetical protein